MDLNVRQERGKQRPVVMDLNGQRFRFTEREAEKVRDALGDILADLRDARRDAENGD